MYLIPMVEAFNKEGEKKDCESFSNFFLDACYFSGEHFDSCKFPYGRLLTFEIF